MRPGRHRMDDLWKYNGADWLGFALTFASIHMLGSRKRAGFIVGIVGGGAWMWVSIEAESTAMAIANVVFSGLNLRGYLNWKHDDDETPDAAVAA